MFEYTLHWRLVRPDAINALDDKMVRKILPRYVEVAKDKLFARFQVAKRIRCPIDIDKLDEEELWDLHEYMMKDFYNKLGEIDKGIIDIRDMPISQPSLLDLKILLTKKILKSCELCEWKCHINRLEGKVGVCKVGNECLISSEFIHLGEEPYIVPSHTIFFMGCTFKCQFCQNYTISQWYEKGESVSTDYLARVIELRRREGCRNVNFVGGEPTPHLFFILEILKECRANIPVIWNSNFYMSEKAMKILDGIIDMYLSDFKYGNDACALRLSKVRNYFYVCARNHKMALERGEVTLRHLLLPNHIECCTKPILDWISSYKDKCIINIMDQYTPYWRASNYPDIARRINKEEFNEAVRYAERLGLNFIT